MTTTTDTRIRTLLLGAIIFIGGALAASAASRGAQEAPSSSLTKWDAQRTASLAQAANPGLLALRVQGNSMLPWFGDGSVVLAEEVEFGQLRVGDLVVYELEGTLVCHRLTKQAGDSRFWARGVNNSRPDPEYVTAENVKARVVAVIYTSAAQPETAPRTAPAEPVSVVAAKSR